MSSDAADSDSEITSFSTTFAISLTTQKTTPPKAGSKAAPKVTKDTKTKETKFTVNKDNYLDFLKALLSKHGEKRYKITERSVFSFKYLCPPTWNEYEDMVRKIFEKKPKKVTISVDMTDIKKGCQKAQNDSDNSDSEKGQTKDESNGAQLSDLETALTKIRNHIVKKYEWDDDDSITYRYNDGSTLRLTPFLIKEWARAIYDMQATLNTPPNTQAFDPANRGVSLVAPGCCAQPIQSIPATPAPPPMSELGHLSTLVTTLFGANPAFTTPLRVPSILVPAQQSDSQAPLIPSPSDISRFLKHASTTLRVCNALDFESPLRHKGFGPDILPDIDSSALVALGISEGDVLRLKNGSRKWWNGPNVKRKHSKVDDMDFFSHTANRETDTSTAHYNKRCHYEYCFPEGGGTRYNGPPMMEGERGLHDEHTTYRDEGRQRMVPIPNGYTAPLHDAPDFDE